MSEVKHGRDVEIGQAKLFWSYEEGGWIAPGRRLIKNAYEAQLLCERMDDIISGRKRGGVIVTYRPDLH